EALDYTRPNHVMVAGQAVAVPGYLPGPALELDARQVRSTAAMLEAALIWFRASYPDIPMTLVYVPSVLSVYRLADAAVTVEPLAVGGAAVGSTVQQAARGAPRSDG